jgi:hypothetical protein
VALAVALAAITTLLGAVRPSLAVSAGLFSVAAFVSGGRVIVSSALGLAAPAEHRAGAMAMRAASTQFGYFIGSFAAGAALALGGYPALGAAIGGLFLGTAAVLHAGRRPARGVSASAAGPRVSAARPRAVIDGTSPLS